MYYPTLLTQDLPWNNSFEEWFAHVHRRLDMWHQTTRQSINLLERIEFYELLFQSQILRLNRPSPRFPHPSLQMRKKALQASIALIKEFSAVDRVGKLFNIWHAAYYVVEAGICLMATILTGMISPGQVHSHLEGEEIPILAKYVKTFPSLLGKISRRWPKIAAHASALNEISLAVTEKLQQWSSGATLLGSDLYGLQEMLVQFSKFSPIPSATQMAVGGETTNVTIVEPYPVIDVNTLPLENGLVLETTGFQAMGTSSAPALVDWAGPYSAAQDGTSVYSDPYGFNGADTLTWDFAGMDSEEILAALLDGEPLIPDGITDSA